eukprot:SAG22_NODE_107_length_19899_cov_24.034141_7_plen_1894_part_00
MYSCAVFGSPSQLGNISESTDTDVSSVLFDASEHGITQMVMCSVCGPIGFRNNSIQNQLVEICAKHSDVSNASENGDLVPIYTIGFNTMLALLLTRKVHSWIPSIPSVGLYGCLAGFQKWKYQKSKSVQHQRSRLNRLLCMVTIIFCAVMFQPVASREGSAVDFVEMVTDAATITGTVVAGDINNGNTLAHADVSEAKRLAARRTQEDGTECADSVAFISRSTAVMAQCCPPPTAGDDVVGASSNCELPSKCDNTGCADEFLAFFNDCGHRLISLPREQLQPLQDFNRACETYTGGIGVRDAVVLSANALAPPPCEDARENCATLTAALSCENDLCPTCGLAHQCDLSCDLCERTNGGSGSDPLLLCFELTCKAPSAQQNKGVVIASGCEVGGALGSTCRLGCSSGYDESDVSEGVCAARWLADEQVTVAEYSGQNVTCNPARNADGTLSASFCRMQLAEVVLDCCEMAAALDPDYQEALQQAAMAGSGTVPVSTTACNTESPPTTCTLGCAELWLPMFEDCEDHMTDFQQLTAACELQASSLVEKAPSTIMVSGMLVHTEANGLYSIEPQTVGGKPCWAKRGAGDEETWYLYAVNEPHDAWTIGRSLSTNSAAVETYEGHPPYGQHAWSESSDAQGGTATAHISLDPGYSDQDCRESLTLMSPELTESCCKLRMEEGGGYTTRHNFEQLLAAGTGPDKCEYDCAALFHEFSVDCRDFLGRNHPGLAQFSALCSMTHQSMIVYDVDGTLAAGGHDDHFFNAEQGVVYEVKEVPGDGLQRTELVMLAAGTHHPLTEKLDFTEQRAGPHTIEWAAPQREAGVDIDVNALEGQGDYHMRATIVGTTERLSRDAIVNRNVLLQTECRFDDCGQRYGGLQMRSDGSSFPLKFRPTAGFTYNISATLRNMSGSAVHLRFSVYPPDSIATGGTVGSAAEAMGGCDLLELPKAVDTGEISVGSFSAPPAGGQTWGEAKCAEGVQGCCENPTVVGPPEAPCDGNYQHFPGRHAGESDSWAWTCPYTSEYILVVHSNCDVQYYADANQPGCTETEAGIQCEDPAIERCEAGLDLRISTVDVSVHVRQRFEVPILPGFGGASGRRVLQHSAGAAREQQLDTLTGLFRTDQQSGLAFPTSITPFDCDVPEHHSRPICLAQHSAGGGGHRRRRLQQRSCPHANFVRRELEMMTVCGLTGDVATDADALDLVACPDLACAEAMTSLLEDCTASIEHLGSCGVAVVNCNSLVEDCVSLAASCAHDQQAQSFYTALEHSALFAGCEEMEQTHAQFAEVEVEFRAPSLAAASEMIESHQAMVDMFSQPGGGCSGRRSLRDEDQHCAAELLVERKQNQRLKAELSATKTLLEVSHAVIENKDERIAELETQLAQLHDLKASKHHLNHRRQQQEQEADQALMMMQRADGAPTMCATAPCELDGACMHGGTCSPLPEDSREGAFLCSCAVGYDGGHCETDIDECASTPCQNSGACIDSSELNAAVPLDAYMCSCVDGYSGGNCGRLGYANVSNCVAGLARGMETCSVYLEENTTELGTISVNAGEHFEIHGNQGEPKLRLLANFGVNGALVLADLQIVGGSGDGGQMNVEAGAELTFERVQMDSGSLTFAGVVSLLESSLVEAVVTGTSGSEMTLSGGTLTGSTIGVTSGRMSVDSGCVLTDSPISASGFGGSVMISGAELQSDGSSVPLTVESNGMGTVTQTVFRSTAGDITAVSVAEGGNMTVGESQLVDADGSVDPFPCDGTLPDCVGEHDGSVVVEGPSAINMAAPLVCDVETSECLSDLCFVVDCGVGGTCVSPHGTCTCSNGYSGDRCEIHKCCSEPQGSDYCRSFSSSEDDCCTWSRWGGDENNHCVCCCNRQRGDSHDGTIANCDRASPGWDVAQFGDGGCDRHC